MTARAWWSRWEPRSIHDKLAVPFAVVIGLIALSVSLYFPRTMELREVAALKARGRSVAEITAFSLQSALVFGDVGDMREGVLGAFTVSEIARVRVFDRSGSLLTEVTRDGGAGGEVTSAPAAGEADLLEAAADVISPDGARLGNVVVHLSQAQLHRDVAALRTTVQVVSAVIFLVGVLSLLILGRILTRPLFRIVETAEAVATGDLSRRSPVTTRDELGKMATAFNRMLDQLQATRGELEVVNRDLEARVEERTRRWEEEQEQRLRAEEEILHLERFYRNVLDAVPLEVAVFDSEGRYVFLNPSAGQDYETPDGMVGRRPSLEDFRRPVNADVLNRRAQAIRQVLDTACLVTLEERLESRDPGAPDGFRAFIRVFTPMLVSEGKVTRVVAYGVDITSLREAEEALRVSEEKLRQSQKMEAVGRLAGGIAHDFNNLLTVIVGHTELLLADKAGGDPDVEELNQMKSAADRATTLTRQLLAFSRRQVLQPRLLQMNRVVSDLESLLVRLLGEQVSLLTILRPDAGQVRADPGQLEQILMNLVANARDAMPEGGTLTIETNRITSAQAAGRWGDPVEPGQYVMLSVRDTGIGIPEENLPRIFEPFFTTKDVGRGTGLGLATVYGIVEQSAGFIFVSSSVGLGTVFRIYLPEAISAAAVSGPSEASGDRRETILIVEDEPLVRDLSARVLERSGYQVLLATGGHEALGILRNLSAPIDLLVTDLVMPGIMGHELAARVREALPDLPVLYMSGFADGALMDRLAGDDGVVMLQKPFTPERLLQAVRRTLARNPTRSTL